MQKAKQDGAFATKTEWSKNRMRGLSQMKVSRVGIYLNFKPGFTVGAKLKSCGYGNKSLNLWPSQGQNCSWNLKNKI